MLTWVDSPSESKAHFAWQFRCVAQMSGRDSWFMTIYYNSGAFGTKIYDRLCGTREDAKADAEQFVKCLAKDVADFVANPNAPPAMT